MEIGEKAPEFSSLDQNGKKIALKDFKGKWVVLYFYPRADTPGCTIEACGFRDSYERIERDGRGVAGRVTGRAQGAEEIRGEVRFAVHAGGGSRTRRFAICMA